MMARLEFSVAASEGVLENQKEEGPKEWRCPEVGMAGRRR
jgi:hypothetical protein